ncbi:hypothetical protein FACS1894127_4510 [Clostridia bacterium]|nr:hypothetical protein FACS1894127_4510 [Clostridia bacterium]
MRITNETFEEAIKELDEYYNEMFDMSLEIKESEVETIKRQPEQGS